MEADLVLDARAALGEGPVWDDRTGVLWWVDILAGRVHAFDPSRGTDRAMTVGQFVGALALRQSGGAVAALQHGFHFVDLATGEVTQIADPEADRPYTRFNDGKCDPRGRFWAGTLAFQGRSTPEGSLYCLEPDLSVRRAFGEVFVSNGIDWSPDLRTMYYIDSLTRRVDAFDFDPDTGALANRRAVVTIPEGEGIPDGMTVDEEGMLWVAQWTGWRLCRWDPRTGHRLAEVRFPVARVTSCAFGGPNLDELYVTTASTGVVPEEAAQQPHAGGLFRVRPGVRGLAANRFSG